MDIHPPHPVHSWKEFGDPTNASATDIQRFREQVVALQSVLYIEEQLARAASERYEKALE